MFTSVATQSQIVLWGLPTLRHEQQAGNEQSAVELSFLWLREQVPGQPEQCIWLQTAKVPDMM